MKTSPQGVAAAGDGSTPPHFDYSSGGMWHAHDNGGIETIIIKGHS